MSRSRALIEDVNQKQGQHVAKNDRWSQMGVLVIRNKLPYGDYILAPPVVVDTKRDIYELYSNLMGDHRRFRDAAIKAMEAGSHLVVLVENDDGVASLADLEAWTEPDAHYKARKRRNAKSVRMDGAKIADICRTMAGRYGIEFDFCAPSDSWRRVLEHLGVIVK